MPQSFDLDPLLNSVNGITRFRCDPASPHLRHLSAGDQALPKQLWDQPMLIHAQFTDAPAISYPIWTCWCSLESLSQPALEPLVAWQIALGDSAKRHPVLLVARATGRFDTLPKWDAKLPALLDEKSPLGPPDGRMLLLANPHLPTLATGLGSALSLYFASLTPNTSLVLPQGCLLIRSGHHSFVMESILAVRLFMARGIGGNSSALASPAGPFMVLPPGLSARCHLQGNLLWGAWRGESGTRTLTTRFVASTCRASHAFSARFEVANSLSRWQRHEILSALASGKETSPGHLPATEDPVSRRFFANIERRLRDALTNDTLLQQALQSPYQLLFKETGESPLGVFTAMLPPNPVSRGNASSGDGFPGNGLWGDGTAGTSPDWSPAESARFVPLSALLPRPRDLQILPPLRNAATTRHFARQKPEFVSLYGPDSDTVPVQTSRQKSTEVRFNSGVCPVEHTMETLARLYAIAKGLPDVNAESLTVKMSWQRPKELLLALLPEIALAIGLHPPSAQQLRLQVHNADALECELVAELSPAWIHAASSSPGVRNRAEGWLRSAAASMQKTLRAFLALSALRSETDCQDSVWTRALLVHRHARLLPPTDATTLVLDPRKDADFLKTATGSLSRLQRKAATWQRFLRQAGIPYPKLGPEAFAAHQVRLCLENPFHLRRILLEEQELCELLRHMRNPKKRKLVSNADANSGLLKADEFTRALLRPANRIYPGGTVRELVPLLVFSACVTMAEATAPCTTEQHRALYRLRLQPLDKQGKPTSERVWLEPRGKSTPAASVRRNSSYLPSGATKAA